MLRSLWTAASGMTAQQMNIDTISNNIANVNTTGYKKESVEFKSLMYQTIQQKATDNSGNVKPVGVQVGMGVRTGSILTSYSQGALNESNGEYDFAIQGSGFFAVQLPDGSVGFTRNGDFNMSIGTNGMTLTTTSGYSVLDTNGNPIVIPQDVKTSDVSIDQNGYVVYKDDTGNYKKTGTQIGLAYFSNPAGLDKVSDSVLKQSQASGEPTLTDATKMGSSIVAGYLESSNVQSVDEMVNLIVAQRAYEMNSKAITASDEMLKTANNLR